MATTTKRRGAFFEVEKFAQCLKELVDAVPSEEDKQQIASQLETLIHFLNDLKTRLESIPTRQDCEAVRTAIDNLRVLFIEAKSNPVLSAALGIKAATPSPESPKVTSEETEHAKSMLAQISSLTIDEIRSALETMTASDLQSIATALGIRTTRTARKHLVHHIVAKITNARGYRSLRDGVDQP